MKLHIIRQRSLWWAISALVILSGIVAMFISWQQIGAPLRPSLDFVGGTRLQLELDCTQPNNCDQPIQAGTVREILARQGLEGSSIQILDDYGVAIRTSNLPPEQRVQLQENLAAEIGTFDPELTLIDFVGPTIGRQIFTAGLLALIISFAGIMVYLSFRFQPDYAIFAIIALFHDVLVTVGIFAILGLTIGVEVDSLFIVALLTIVGFSVNDTVVIYDRIRETIKMNPDRPIDATVDDAVNQTLARTINTSLTTTLPLIAIFFLGGDTLKYFALALIVGFIAGAYSSIFVASTLLAWWRERSEKVVPVTVDEAEG